MKTIEAKNVIGVFVKATKKENGGKVVTLYGMIDGTYCNDTQYGIITALKDGTWISCLVNPEDATFLTNESEIAMARANALAYCKAEKDSLDKRIAKLLGIKKGVEELEATANKK